MSDPGVRVFGSQEQPRTRCTTLRICLFVCFFFGGGGGGGGGILVPLGLSTDLSGAGFRT